ncbi:MAG: putative sulfate exporter family transporter [Rhodospirillaceae bacterium]|nr:putative sulfate exporter family transporter [Rhodospirillaceae bacterium]
MPSDPSVPSLSTRLAALSPAVPGVVLAVAVAAAGMGVAHLVGGPGLLYVLVLGLLLGPLAHARLGAARLAPGLGLASRTVLHLGVMLLGLRIGVSQLSTLTVPAICFTLLGMASTIAVGVVLARLLGFSTLFGILTGAATAICGSSAAVAVSAVLPQRPGGDRETLFTVLGVTALSTAVFLIYPFIVQALDLPPPAAGLFLGGSIHNVPQVIGAGYVVDHETGDVATLIKLVRVSMLAPVVVLLGLWVRATWHTGTDIRPPPLLPWFLIGFIVLAAANSFALVPDGVVAAGSQAGELLLVLAVAAIGLKTDFVGLKTLGLRAILLMVAQTLWIGAVLLGGALIV